MARPKTADDAVSISLRVPRALADRLREAANERVIGKDYIVRMALEQFLAQLIPVEQLTLTRERTIADAPTVNPDG